MKNFSLPTSMNPADRHVYALGLLILDRLRQWRAEKTVSPLRMLADDDLLAFAERVLAEVDGKQATAIGGV